VQEFINSEKEKRFLRDNPPVVLESPVSDNTSASVLTNNSETVSDADSTKKSIKNIA